MLWDADSKWDTMKHIVCADIEVNLLKKIRLEIAVNAEYVQPTIDGIIAGGKKWKNRRWKDFLSRT